MIDLPQPAADSDELSGRLPSGEAVVLVGLALLNFALKYATAIVLANALGVHRYELYAVPVASVTLFATLVELGLGKQGIRLLPQFMEIGEHGLAAGYWRFAMRTVLGLGIAVGVLVSLQEALVPQLGSFASDEAMYLLPIVALTGVGAELVLACGAAIVATVIIRLVLPATLLALVWWSAATLTPEVALLAYGASWLLAGLLLFIAFVVAAPARVLRGPSEFRLREWLRGGLGFLGVAVAISALVDGTVALSEFASVPAADISIYAVCIETGAFVLILVKSLDKFYLQQISALITRGEVAEIHRIRRRRAGLITTICVLFCAGLIVWGRPLLSSFGEGFERGYVPLCCVGIATSAWTLASLSQWLIAFIDGPKRAFQITITGVFAAYSAILVFGPSRGLMGVALSYAIMVLAMSVVLELRARVVLRRLAEQPGPSELTS